MVIRVGFICANPRRPSSSVFLRSEFWTQFLPGLYYAGIAIAGLESGWKAGLAAGIVSGIFHAEIGGLFWAGPVTGLEGQLLAFLVLGFALIQQRRLYSGQDT
jgi:thiamine transporter ThiT